MSIMSAKEKHDFSVVHHAILFSWSFAYNPLLSESKQLTTSELEVGPLSLAADSSFLKDYTHGLLVGGGSGSFIRSFVFASRQFISQKLHAQLVTQRCSG